MKSISITMLSLADGLAGWMSRQGAHRANSVNPDGR